ncbi:hypothetical protein [aff. Roholtiella sp. LEGE 12411]|uniref:hypothetical protein n=1 Tax=aff. Roholtiella sp. LEGE 12411 TaxID=1828822 RepID=UPI00187DF319|nr:hypothetical protein [aff. Roholtiella sp. LEGE 12411]MBE9034955.1 hypothetical protein [aff. Roholtiella sp. LEGE 12411]
MIFDYLLVDVFAFDVANMINIYLILESLKLGSYVIALRLVDRGRSPFNILI